MATQYKQSVNSGQTRFVEAPLSELEFSTMVDKFHHLTTFNAGDIIPIYCAEVLPHDTFSVDLDFVIRQSTSVVPVMGQLVVDYYAFFVPNRVVNKSWKNVQGENTSGSWIAPEVSLATLGGVGSSSVQVPVGSVADYYGFPTQGTIPVTLLQQMHDLKFRGYVEIYNQYFRDQNYIPPIPYSKLNVFNGFFEPVGTNIYLNGNTASTASSNQEASYTGWKNQGSEPVNSDGSVNGGADGSYPVGAILESIYGGTPSAYGQSSIGFRKTTFSALGAPLKAAKIHDYFTSVLPSPQKGRQVSLPLVGQAPLNTVSSLTTMNSPIKLGTTDLGGLGGSKLGVLANGVFKGIIDSQFNYSANEGVDQTNLVADMTNSNIGITVNDMRFSAAMQQVYELLGRNGSRYESFIKGFFGLEVDNPFEDIPTLLGHFRRDLDLYQTAQTSASTDTTTPQGTLAAFGYTAKDGSLFTRTFVEHGYVHIMAVVRHKNIYSSYLAPDNFRLNQFDFYLPQLANVGETPVFTRTINPFSSEVDGVFGFQEYAAEYRYEPDRVSGLQRAGVPDSLAYWNYSDDFDSSIVIANGDWIQSNTAEILRRSTAVSEQVAPQFKADFCFQIKKERPMPVYSVPGMDIF